MVGSIVNKFFRLPLSSTMNNAHYVLRIEIFKIMTTKNKVNIIH